MKVLITDKVNECVKDIIADVSEAVFLPTMSEDELVKVIGEYDALMVRSQTKVTKRIIEAGKNLKIIGRAGVGVDNIDVEAATEKGIIVVNSPDGNTIAASEHTIALMLAVSRNIVPAAVSTKEAKWNRDKFTGNELLGKTLGVMGFGRIGRKVVHIALAIGMKVIVYDPFATEEIVQKAGAVYETSLDEFLPKLDYLSLHIPKTPETNNIINKDNLCKMKNTAIIINCSRGGLVNEEDLKNALENGTIAAAAVDVFVNEPKIETCPLVEYKKDNLILTPHLGASTKEAQINVALDVAKQIKQVLSGGYTESAVNIPSLNPEKLEPVKDYMKISENAGEMIMQTANGKIKSLEITAQGDLINLDIQPLEVAILKGALSYMFQDVNYVNAPYLAKQRGIEVKTIKSEAPSTFTSILKVKLTTDKDTSSVSVSLIAKNIARIVKFNDYDVIIKPQPHILIVPHINQPAMIAKVATVLSGDGINIGSMSVSENIKGSSTSIMAINVDRVIGNDVITKISNIEGVQDPKYVRLTAEYSL
ncbi:phosphoglycerate dehydrogenase [Brachyspira hyodysenteriae]|uniref:phosphoglycerate dehydrogenase n=1 Tax=Brachyspira hyodysenteriae TaxID=159 RepID=UPI00063DCE69|nr:phosphoglycerate dehydrogenase [Brachyspira hyodysenteriae]KLI40828.1 3-phosphoglycerate dehydrogenase [Brachyspira hyodysenteriae]KLI48786.1 3-phosphoglycerate dehydrogenase [Brachyspira hyodysenteriae]MCZ9960572.1 phosphoglycerate dehydrogenase [Brachyspira hyodysenteriae]